VVIHFHDEPTRTPDTEAGYLKRFKQLFNSIKKSTLEGDRKFTVAVFVDGLLEKRGSYRANSWRYNRNATIFGLQQKAMQEPGLSEQIARGIERLRTAPALRHDDDLPARTSSSKQNRFFEEDFERVCHLALSRRSSYAEPLTHFLHATMLTGCRPCEWPSAALTWRPIPGYEWELKVQNAKNSNGRGLGDFRILRWSQLSRDLVEHVNECIAMAESSNYPRMLATMGTLLADLTDQLFPNRDEHPTLYSARHEAIARWKSKYLWPGQTADERIAGLAMVAALAGHASDETATIHYGRPRRGRDRISAFPIPSADPERIAMVRQVFRFNQEVLRPDKKTQDFA
jgi:integrase